eukprot:1149082-Pelagomonas_calceolata.AAC.3
MCHGIAHAISQANAMDFLEPDAWHVKMRDMYRANGCVTHTDAWHVRMRDIYRANGCVTHTDA